MTTTRRSAMIGLGAAASLAGCTRQDEGRGGDVVAAGQPAALLIWAVAPARLAGWPRRPSPEALTALPAFAGDLPELGALGGGGGPANPETLAALRPSLVIDYGDTDPENHALGHRMSERLGVDWRLIDGALARIPAAIREAGGLLDAGDRAGPLADEADAVLARWRSAPAGPSFYYARGVDGLETGFRGALATEVLEGGGWTNVAEGGSDIGRVSREQVAAWDPEAVVTLSADFAEAARLDSVWRVRRNGDRRRLLLLPDRPFGWIDRPPSVNRLLGCAWLARPRSATVAVARLTRRLYGLAPTEVPGPRWIL